MQNFLNLLTAQTDWVLILLRVSLAAIFFVHGWPKLKNFKSASDWFASQGFKPGWFWCAVVGIVEFGGALLLILGSYIQIVALIMAGNMVVALLHNLRKGKPFKDGWEMNLLLIASLLLLATFGAGQFFLF